MIWATAPQHLTPDPDDFERFRNKQAYLKGPCKSCPAATDCLAGCTSIALSASGEIGHNPYCIRALENEEILNCLG